jgi:hypothetical protein
MTAAEQQKKLAATIYEQLGGRRFALMTGAKDFLSHADGLTFAIPRTRSIRKVRVLYAPNDTYTLEFYSVGKVKGILDVRLRDRRFDVHAEQLGRVFTDVTGLHTRLR